MFPTRAGGQNAPAATRLECQDFKVAVTVAGVVAARRGSSNSRRSSSHGYAVSSCGSIMLWHGCAHSLVLVLVLVVAAGRAPIAAAIVVAQEASEAADGKAAVVFM